jgi:hypothetical protein
MSIKRISTNSGRTFYSFQGAVNYGKQPLTEYRLDWIQNGEWLTYEQICELAEAEKNQPQEEAGQ